MSEATFTPGPWRVGMSNGFNASTIYTADDIGICDMYGVAMHRRVDEVQNDPGIANARLIAACPDLYAALHSIVRLMESMVPMGYFTSEEWEQRLESARAALPRRTVLPSTTFQPQESGKR